MRTHFNLATAPLENNRRFIAGSCLLGIVALAAMVLLSMHVIRARRTNEKTRTEISQLQSQIRMSVREQESLRETFKSAQAVEALKRSEFLNGLIEERTFPWTKMFADLERILPPGVRVISIAPQMDREGHVKVVLLIGAANDEQEIAFLKSISESRVFTAVAPTQGTHSQKAADGGADKVQMTLEAYYSSP